MDVGLRRSTADGPNQIDRVVELGQLYAPGLSIVVEYVLMRWMYQA